MQEHRIYKALEKWKKARDKKIGAEITPWHLQKTRLQRRGYIIPFEKGEKKDYPKMVIGYALCTHCKIRVQAVNDMGTEGSPFFDYLSDHYDDLKAQLCKGSKKRLFILLSNKR